MTTDPEAAPPAVTLSPKLEDLAARLWAVRRDGGIIDADSPDVTQPKTLSEAYAVQLAVIAQSGETVRGFKVGSTSAEAQNKLGTTEPGSCPMPASLILQSPACFAVDPDHHPAVEGEFALRLGQDMPARPDGYSFDEVRAAVDQVAGAIELVGSRFAGGLDGKGRLLVTADSGADMALILGAKRPFTVETDLRGHGVSIRVNGETKGEGTGARALGDPLNVLHWLVNQQSQWGRGMFKGEWIATGTCTGLDAVGPGDAIAADFGDLGVVELTLETG
ncbi:MAG: hypothetical protein RIA64_11555 [Rhodospirillales bacterium]